MKNHWSVTIIKVALFVTIAIAGFGQAVHQLWNWLMPNLFGLRPIDFWQSVGLMALCWILFGGWRGFRGPGHGHRPSTGRGMLERWNEMGPEERAKLREGMRGCRPAKNFAEMSNQRTSSTQ